MVKTHKINGTCQKNPSHALRQASSRIDDTLQLNPLHYLLRSSLEVEIFPNIPNHGLYIVSVEQDLAAEKSVAAPAASKSQVVTCPRLLPSLLLQEFTLDAGVQVQVAYMRPGENGGPATLHKKKRSKNGVVSTGDGLRFHRPQ
ncbi:hypothetical protein C1H46_019322 [Malus baccata]|uniref:Uncharacterized protein n=1 Tax=Malus baccata TaxID=106549 RepID=A0A540M8H4_MALBA|nr:hypothetical protein C1H46_019322 [Malus baccata]